MKDIEIRGNFWCDNNNLTTLKNAPHKIGGSFSCTNNPLENLEGLPEPNNVGGNIWIT
jgi:hypothetical protein